MAKLKRMTRSQALDTAARDVLAREVAYEIDHNNCSPEEALAVWDIL